ncbi:hypothetical protein BO85DRAFT_448784, partial [Aspergillus piperis CBS 112811]
MSRHYAVLLEILVNAAVRTSQPATTPRNRVDNSSRTCTGESKHLFFGINCSDFGQDWIWDPSIWESLPDMVGLDIVPGFVESMGV